MKTRNIFALAALGLLGLSACSSEEELASNNQNKPEPVKFEVSIKDKLQSRTIPYDDEKSTQFKEGDEIRFSTYLADNEFDNQVCIYKYQDNQWIPKEGQTPVCWTGSSLNIYLEHPALDTSKGFNVPTDQSTPDKMAAADYLSVNSFCSYEPILSLPMFRNMARVNITGFTFTGDLANKNAQIIDFKFYSQKVVGGSAPAEYVEVSPMKVDQGYMALLAPVTQTSNQNFAKVTVSYGDNGATNTKDFFVKNTPSLIGGYKYEFSLKVGVTQVEMEAVSVKPWTDAPDTNIEMNTTYRPIVDAAAHKVKLKKKGTLNIVYLNEAFGSGNNDLTVEGPAIDKDLQIIADFCKTEGKTVNLNISNLTEITTLPANNFKDCKALSQITLPTSITELGANALANTGLTEFTIPETVTTIGEGILSGCTNLTTIRLNFAKKADVAYNYSDKAFAGVGTTKDVTLYLHSSWIEGVENGTEQNKFTYRGGTFTKPAKVYAVKFDNAGICIEKNDFLQNNELKSVTYEALVNFNSFNGNNTIIGKEEHLLLRVGDVRAKPSVPKNITQLRMKDENNLRVDDNYGFKTNTWYHLAMTYNAADGRARIYINGAKVAEQNCNTDKSFNLRFFRNYAPGCVSIGRFADYDNDNRPFDGMMKEVRIWNVARTADEIKNNMLQVDPATEELKVYYKLDGTDIINGTVINQVTKSADGTIHNGGNGSLTAQETEHIVIQ